MYMILISLQLEHSLSLPPSFSDYFTLNKINNYDTRSTNKIHVLKQEQRQETWPLDIYSGTFLWNSLHETITQCKSLTFISQQAKKKLLLFAQLDTGWVHFSNTLYYCLLN